MNDLFLKIINMSISASWLVLAVLLLRFVLKKAPKWVNVLLWGIVAVRLAFPFSIESALSLIPSAETVPMDIEMAVQPTINSGVPVINSMVNPTIIRSRAYPYFSALSRKSVSGCADRISLTIIPMAIFIKSALLVLFCMSALFPLRKEQA